MANILINYLGENGSGPVFSLEMAEGIAQNGHKVYAVVSDRLLNLDDWKKADFFEKLVVMPTYSSKKDYFLHLPKYTTGFSKKVAEELQGIHFDCVIRTFPHAMLDATEKKLDIEKNITICHDPITHSGEAFSAKIRNRMVMKKAEYVLVLTREFVKQVSENYRIPEEKVFYMPHGMMRQYKKKQQKEAMVAFDSSCVNFVFFGRIEDYKGIPVLLEAFAKLEEKYDHVTLTVAGSGNVEKYREQMGKLKHFHLFDRYIKDEEVGTLFDHESVVAVIPYVDATQSGVIPIALEYGNAIIATKTGGLMEQLDEGKIGLFAEPGDAAALMACMEKAMDPEIRKEQGELGKSFAETLSWKNVTSVLQQIL